MRGKTVRMCVHHVSASCERMRESQGILLDFFGRSDDKLWRARSSRAIGHGE